MRFGFASSTMQLVSTSVDPAVCPSGWTLLQEQLVQEGNEHIVPMQSSYVTQFESLQGFQTAATNASMLFGPIMPTLRLSLVWPCWMASEQWRSEMKDLIANLLTTGYTIEVTLSHHDSYPAELHDGDSPFDLPNSGWAHESAVTTFVAYVDSVTKELGGVLPAGSRVYLINEPIGMLFNSYFGDGSWPPGGKKSESGFVRALLNMREALITGSNRLALAGWQPAIAKNLRLARGTQGEKRQSVLNYVFNWWLLDALVDGCIDDDFDLSCESTMAPSALHTIGVTYYGQMYLSDMDVTLTTDVGSATFPLPIMDFVPNSMEFGYVLNVLHTQYPNIHRTISELGFSAGNTNTQRAWLQDYLSVIEPLVRNGTLDGSVQIHTMFESAEFSAGEWFFHAVTDCHDSTSCELTAWGVVLLELATHYQK